MEKNEIEKIVKDMMNANSCCAELKKASQEWLDAVGTSKEAEMTDKLKKEIKADITSIDDLIALCESDMGKKIFGEDTAKAMAKRGKENKANGAKYCFCDACSNAEKLLNVL